MTAARFQRALRRLRRDERGATIVEFAIVLPVMCLMLVGAFDISHTLYTRGVLQGIVQKTARDSTMETADTNQQATLDSRVRAHAKKMSNKATIDITRRYYRTFSDAAAARAEAWTDTNGNGSCDANEPYQDENRNQAWDVDGGNSGQGGAKDAVLYTVTVTYPRMLPLPRFLGTAGGPTAKVVATTVLKNQPYGDQGTYAPPTVRNCTT